MNSAKAFDLLGKTLLALIFAFSQSLATLAAVHVTPSGEERMPPPTATYCVPDQVTPFIGSRIAGSR